MIEQWKYPDSKMEGANLGDATTVNDAGVRTTQSILYKTVLTTYDPVQKVVEYYKHKLKPPADLKPATTKEDVDPGSGRSVMFHEDSAGRPMAIHIILINTEQASTTLVISRGAKELKTHIAWTHYLKLLNGMTH